jgi:hypothetical protein
MKIFNWDPEKNAWLQATRNLCFEDVVYFLENGGCLDDLEHPNQAKYPGQSLLVIEMEGYAYLVPYVETQDEIFLKTIIPSRKATKKYLGG